MNKGVLYNTRDDNLVETEPRVKSKEKEEISQVISAVVQMATYTN